MAPPALALSRSIWQLHRIEAVKLRAAFNGYDFSPGHISRNPSFPFLTAGWKSLPGIFYYRIPPAVHQPAGHIVKRIFPGLRRLQHELPVPSRHGNRLDADGPVIRQPARQYSAPLRMQVAPPPVYADSDIFPRDRNLYHHTVVPYISTKFPRLSRSPIHCLHHRSPVCQPCFMAYYTMCTASLMVDGHSAVSCHEYAHIIPYPPLIHNSFFLTYS